MSRRKQNTPRFIKGKLAVVPQVVEAEDELLFLVFLRQGVRASQGPIRYYKIMKQGLCDARDSVH